MTERCYLGVDFGAESGRVIAGLWDGKRIQIEELHRFPNGPVLMGNSLRWDVVRLWAEVQAGLTLAAKRFGSSIVSVGADTWGVDFVLLDKHEEMLGQPYHYRDARTRGMLDEAFKRVPRADIFAATGLQFMELNTLYQLLAWQKSNPELLTAAETFLMMPDFMHWCLCGSRVVEFTNATTSQCVHPTKRDWAFDLMGKFGLPTKMFPKIVPPGTNLGALRENVAEKTGLPRIKVVAPPTHDTASAVAGVPTTRTGKANWAYISSGTWSLIGAEVQKAQLSPRALELNYTNEGGIDGTYRLLKNVTGLWLVQQCRRAFEAHGRKYDYVELTRMAGEAPALRSFVDPDDARFMNPPDMPAAIQSYCRDTGQPVPETDAALVRCALESLALKYRATLAGLEELTGEKVEIIHVVGGGSQNRFLNQFTADACNRLVHAGPVEATALGNLLSQVRADGELKNLSEMRAVVRASTQVSEFTPVDKAAWDDAFGKYSALLKRAK